MSVFGTYFNTKLLADSQSYCKYTDSNNEPLRRGDSLSDESIAHHLCHMIEQFAPEYDYHVALTGGCLYKMGKRKDVDIMLYQTRSSLKDHVCRRDDILERLGREGFQIHQTIDWLTKATYERDGKTYDIDFLFPNTPVIIDFSSDKTTETTGSTYL